MSKSLKMCFLSISVIMMVFGIISCARGDIANTVMSASLGIWDVLVALLLKEV